MANPLYISASLHDGPNTAQLLVPYVAALPFTPTTHYAMVLQADAQSLVAGMYFYQYGGWQFCLPIEAVNFASSGGDTLDIYINVEASEALPGNVSIYRNGQLQPGDSIEPDTAVWVASTQAVGPGELVPATTTRLGGVIVPTAGGLSVDVDGNISISAPVLASIDNKIGVVNTAGMGLPLIQSQNSGVLTLKSIQNGQNITIVDDNGTLIISSSGGLSQVELTGDVTGSGAGLVPTTLSATGVVAGTYTKVTVDTKGRVLIGSNPTTLGGYGILDALPLTGGSMTGAITMTGGQTVTGVPDPVFPTDAVNLQSLNAAIAGAANGVNWRAAVDAATVGNITLSGLQVVDGISVVANNRVLVKDQADPKQNGIYVVAAGAWARAGDANTSTEIWKAATLVLGGTVNALTQWTNTNTTAPVIGTDNITWGQLKGAANVYTAGSGLVLNGLQFSIAATGVIAGTWTKVTVNNLGQVTAASNLTPAELAAALGYTPVNRSGDTMQGALNGAPPVTIGASAVTNLASVQANDVIITGTASIQSFGSLPAGSHRDIIFSGGQTLVYNASSMILPGTANIVTAANDVAGFVSLGGGNWQCEYYTRANGTALVSGSSSDPTKLPLAGGTMTGAINEANFVVVPAAATTDLGAANSNNVQINAGATITSFGVAPAGTRRALLFNAAVTLTHNAASLILPGAANIAASVGDIAEFVSMGSGNWRCEYYTKISGQSVVPTAASDPTKLPLAGGTLTGAINYAPAVLVASGSAPNIAAAASNCVSMTGASVINGFTSGTDGMVRYVTFFGACVLIPSGSFTLLGSGNITTANGDVAAFQCQGTTSWKCLWYQRKDGTALVSGAASDPTKLPLAGGTMTGSINMSGATAINYGTPTQAGRVDPFPAGAQANVTILTGDFTPAAGGPLTGFNGGTFGMTRKFVVAAGVTVNMTHNASSFILPTGANIVAVGGDTFEFLCINASPQQWRCINFMRANGQPLAGGGSPFTTFQDFQGSSTVSAARFSNILERAEVSASSPPTQFYVANGAVKYYTGQPSGNWSINISHSSGTALNTAMAIGDSLTLALLVTNGATPYMPNAFLIDSGAVTPKWQGGTAPTAGNASSIDVYSFTIIKTANAAFTMFASQTQFK